MTYRANYGEFPRTAALLFGLGLGGCFDGIVFQQLLQWHHMMSSWYPPTSLANMRLNTRWDGFYDGLACLLVVLGIASFWRKASMRELYWSREMLLGGLLVGWGAFNVVEGLLAHELLGIHHFNETGPAAGQSSWDLAFLAWGALMLVAGRRLERSADRRRKPRDVRVGVASKAAG